ncbi:MAG: hypothetical protein AAF067_10600, partial [Pseudomonadota bacterium]
EMIGGMMGAIGRSWTVSIVISERMRTKALMRRKMIQIVAEKAKITKLAKTGGIRTYRRKWRRESGDEDKRLSSMYPIPHIRSFGRFVGS